MISVEMTTEEAWSYRKFREYQEQFEILLKSGIFEAKKSVVNISIDASGYITDIDINKKAYKRKAKDLTKK